MHELLADHPCLGKVGVGFSGGALQACWHAGAMQALFEHRIPVQCATMASSGALVGASMAGARTFEDLRLSGEYVRDKFLEIGKNPEILFPPMLPKSFRPSDLGRWRRLSLKRMRLFYEDGVLSADRLRRLFDGVDPAILVRKPGLQAGVSVYDIGGLDGSPTRGNQLFWNHDMEFDPDQGGNPAEFIERVVDSARREPLFAPRTVNGRRFADGIYPQLLPLAMAGCRTIFVLFCYSNKELIKAPQTAPLGLIRRILTKNSIFWIKFWSELFPYAGHFRRHYIDQYQEQHDMDELRRLVTYGPAINPGLRVIPVYAGVDLPPYHADLKEIRAGMEDGFNRVSMAIEEALRETDRALSY